MLGVFLVFSVLQVAMDGPAGASVPAGGWGLPGPPPEQPEPTLLPFYTGPLPQFK